MKNIIPLLALCIFAALATPLSAQTTIGIPSQEEFSRLRGINAFYIDVVSENDISQDVDLRNELRDLIELELRRANVAIRALPPGDIESLTPMLRLKLKFDRGMGRFACDMQLEVRDQVDISRNRKSIVATTFRMDRTATGSAEVALRRDVKSKAREVVSDLITGLKKANG